jgi:hypothetical protein
MLVGIHVYRNYKQGYIPKEFGHSHVLRTKLMVGPTIASASCDGCEKLAECWFARSVMQGIFCWK